MMSADEVIESYVRDVARYLPRAKRDDVAFELRALLADELAAKAAAAQRAPDRALVMELLAGFGRPAEAAARYQPRAPLIDPADNHNFLLWALVGAVVVEVDGGNEESSALMWVGLVFVWFALATWLRRRRPSAKLRWRPRRESLPEVASRPLVLLPALATLVFPFTMYLAPERWWRLASFGHGPSGGLALTEAFLASWQRVVTLALLSGVITIYVAVAAQGGWRPWSRQTLPWVYLVLGGLLLMHAAPLVTLFERETFAVFESAAANRVAPEYFRLAGGITLLSALYELYREWARVRPAPALPGVRSA
jgi:hypothetical protein